MDCNKTINFLHELKRLCDSRDGCVANAANKRICAEDVKTAIETVQKWSDEHPKKTYAQDFFEKFPKAQSTSDGAPFVCRQATYGGECPGSGCKKYNYTEACYRCWNETMEE